MALDDAAESISRALFKLLTFNTNKEMSFKSILKTASVVRNHEGAEAYSLSPELELYALVCTMALQPKFYESQDSQIDRLSQLIAKVDATFVAKLAVYARQRMNLRSVPLFLVVELARTHRGDDLVARTTENVVMRADEIAELLMCYQWRNPQSGMKKLGRLSHQIQAGLARAFNRFDEYQFAKYDRNNQEVKLRDALFIVHPKAKDAQQQALFDKIANRQLDTPYTWETELSALGQQKFESDEIRQEAFCEKWEELIHSGKLGYMALMRNLRNLLQSKVSLQAMKEVANRLADAEQVARSKQLPFRYLSAYREIEGIVSTHTAMLMNALEAAVKCSACNIEGFDENTRVLLASDVSGSMCTPISQKSTVRYYDIGLLLSMLLRSRCKQVVSGIFGDTWKVVNMPSDNILMATRELERLSYTVGLSTNGHKVIEWLISEKMVMDKVMMFSDMQIWDSTGRHKAFADTWKTYKKMAPEAKLYLFDLNGYGYSPIQMTRDDVVLLAGWSDRIFDILDAIEHGSDVVKEISGISL